MGMNSKGTLPLIGKLALAVVSAGSYWLLGCLSEQSETLDELLSSANTGLHLVGIVFGALVMAPYALSSNRRALRGVAMCVASAAIYYAAIRFIVDGPFGYDTIVPYLISGGGAAVLVSITVVLVAPRRPRWQAIPLAVTAGTLGGAVFDWSFGNGSEVNAIVGHLAWQVLVCLALHFGLREALPSSRPTQA